VLWLGGYSAAQPPGGSTALQEVNTMDYLMLRIKEVAEIDEKGEKGDVISIWTAL